MQPEVAGLQLDAEVHAAGLRLGMLRGKVDLGRRPCGANGAPVALSAEDYAAVRKLFLHGGPRFNCLRIAADDYFEPPDPDYFAKLCQDIQA